METTPNSVRSMPSAMMNYETDTQSVSSFVSSAGNQMARDAFDAVVDAVYGVVTHERTPLTLPYQVPGLLPQNQVMPRTIARQPVAINLLAMQFSNGAQGVNRFIWLKRPSTK